MAINKRPANISIENAELIFRNFAGNESMYNRDGYRNFCVFIDDDDYAEKLSNEGWNVKILKPRDEEDKPRHYIQVAVNFKNIPPNVYMYQGKVRTKLTEDTVDILDHADIVGCDLIITPYSWEMNGNSGIKAYLKTMHVTVEEDEFAAKYAAFDEGFDEDDIPF